MCALFLLWMVLVVAGLFWWRRFLAGPSLARFDQPIEGQVGQRDEPSAGHQRVLALIADLQKAGRGLGFKKGVRRIRKVMDEDLGVAADQLPEVRVTPVDAGGVPAEWVVARGTELEPHAHRLLYIHGGAFVAGSPRSHRRLVAEIAKGGEVAVLSIDYRLVPEHPRRACIADCRAAYHWILANGPAGSDGGEARSLFVAGDSAGGNLALVLSAWVRDAGLRPPDGVVAFSPATDGTFGSPTLSSNKKSDPMLGRLLAAAARFRFATLMATWLFTRLRPCNPLLSPVHGDLSGLPPTLVQASEAEALVGDARRYVNKARAAGSPVELQTWRHMVHVFQAFGADLEESQEAMQRVFAFLHDHRTR